MNAGDVVQKAGESGVQFIRLQFIDILGIIKDVVIPVERLEEALARGIRFDGSALQGFVRTAESDMLLKPDPHTYRVLPWGNPPGVTALLICSVHHMDGRPFAGCPRANLARVLSACESTGHQLHLQAEVEFYLLRRDIRGGLAVESDDAGGYFDHVPGGDGDEIRRQLVIILRQMRIPIAMSHHENSPGQHEIVIGRDGAMETADHIAVTKAAARRLAAQLGCQATFMPKPRTGMNGSGLHLRLSMLKKGRNSFHPNGGHEILSLTGRFVLAGLLEHASALCAVANPLVNSYKRLVPGYEAPTRLGWSCSSRDPLFRVSGAMDEEAFVEYRGPDPSCNPYLLLACLAQSGVDGLIRKVPLQMPDGSDGRDTEQAAWLPRTLGEALAALESDPVVRDALGPAILPDYVDARRLEWEMYLSQVDRWEVHHYLGKY